MMGLPNSPVSMRWSKISKFFDSMGFPTPSVRVCTRNAQSEDTRESATKKWHDRIECHGRRIPAGCAERIQRQYRCDQHTEDRFQGLTDSQRFRMIRLFYYDSLNQRLLTLPYHVQFHPHPKHLFKIAYNRFYPPSLKIALSF